MFWTGPKEFVVGVYTVGRHPIQTAQGIHYAATHLRETGRAIACDFAEKISTSEGQGQLGCDLILTIATMGGGSAANIGRSGVGIVDKVADASKLRRLSSRGEPVDLSKSVGAARMRPDRLPLIARSVTGKSGVEEVVRRLNRFHGIDRNLASKRLHELKQVLGYAPDDDLLFDLTGNVFDPKTREGIGCLTEGGAKGGF